MNNTLVLGNLTIKKDTREVFIEGQKINLRRKEYDLLEFLAINHGRVLNRLTILEYVWNYHIHTESNTLEAHINSLRKKLKHGCGKNIIKTVHGVGYKLNIEQEENDRQMVLPFFRIPATYLKDDSEKKL